MQNQRNLSQTATPKAKKAAKERDKRKSQTGIAQPEINQVDKPPQTKECREYAGIGNDSIIIYQEQTTDERPSEEVCGLLAEDVNYKLRYIIHDCLVKARLMGRQAISSNDIDEAFENLSIDKVYGASSSPNWVPFGGLSTDQNLLYLDDTTVNLIQIAEDELQYAQQADVIIEKKYSRDDPILEEEANAFGEYFKAICQGVISNDREIQQMALEDVSENPVIAPITDWFYHFAYFLLTKDITYDCLTLRALQLVEVLENSPISNENASEKQLKLLVRLLLQRLLMSKTTREVLVPMCYVLSILCLREPLKQMAIMKIQQKINVICEEMALPVLTIVYYLGIEGVMEIFLPNMNYFLTRIIQEDEPELKEITLSIYDLICKSSEHSPFIHESFREAFGQILVPYWRPKHITSTKSRNDIDFINMKKRLMKLRRKIDYDFKKRRINNLEDFFELPSKFVEKMDTTDVILLENNDRVSFKIKGNNLETKLNKHKMEEVNKMGVKQTKLTVGKTSLLLKVLENHENKCLPKCYDHSLLNYNL